MSVAATPTNFFVQQGNGQVLVSWDIAVGSTNYIVQRSSDGVNYTTVATPTPNQYLDTTVLIGVQYYYQVASVNGSGTSPFTTPASIIPSPTGEMSLAQIRLAAQQRADRQNSEFLTTAEWNSNINQSMFELYDLLVTVYEDYYLAPSAQFITNGNSSFYPLPNGQLTFTNTAGQPFVAEPFYKLTGVDLGLNTANNAFVTLGKFNFRDRNKFIYPNTSSMIYGVYNCQYRVLGSNIEFIPTPSGNQPIRLWYIPRLKQLLQDTDISTTSISGWIEYVIVDAAIKALQKEESDVQVLMAQKMALVKRINESAANRDAGTPDTITDSRQDGSWNSGGGWNSPIGGW